MGKGKKTKRSRQKGTWRLKWEVASIAKGSAGAQGSDEVGRLQGRPNGKKKEDEGERGALNREKFGRLLRMH